MVNLVVVYNEDDATISLFADKAKQLQENGVILKAIPEGVGESFFTVVGDAYVVCWNKARAGFASTSNYYLDAADKLLTWCRHTERIRNVKGDSVGYTDERRNPRNVLDFDEGAIWYAGTEVSIETMILYCALNNIPLEVSKNSLKFTAKAKVLEANLVD